MTNYDAAASLHKWETLDKKRAGDAQTLGAAQIWNGTLAGCVKQFMAKPQSQQPLYDIMVDEDAGVGKTILEPSDIHLLAKREDFPNA
jgi:hypothetical protein